MKEEDIRPKKVFDEYLSLARSDAEIYFGKSTLLPVVCPGCGNEKGIFKFRKMGFDYEECPVCGTLYNNPRPVLQSFNDYYSDSPSVRFWATNFYKETEQSRRELLIKPKAKLCLEILQKYYDGSQSNPAIVDIGAGYGVFCEEFKKILPKSYEMIGIEPAKALISVCRDKQIPVIPKFFEDVTVEDFGNHNVVCAVSFELIEHLHSPELFIQKCSEIIPKNGLLILTTLTWDGFDLKVLADKSDSIHPPHHINFFTKKSIKILLENYGFSICEITTPGKLDVDIVSKKSSAIKDSFVSELISCDNEIKEMFQKFLQDARLSSHMMVVAKKIE